MQNVLPANAGLHPAALLQSGLIVAAPGSVAVKPAPVHGPAVTHPSTTTALAVPPPSSVETFAPPAPLVPPAPPEPVVAPLLLPLLQPPAAAATSIRVARTCDVSERIGPPRAPI